MAANRVVFSFDEAVEILRGPDYALAIHNRRTRLALESMPDIWDEASQDALREKVRRQLEGADV